ncbi:hypothetical protein Clacol_001764 [Clathrus columnatus]|uniref:Uncharacterized protein n=1 Tax=Clathrus columnatus TaxID=1419009 RepID=A0AAV4ZYZ7_9AGAM|nr:hypothetical protein Clacol_001764 [Clathrus columnatus]
MSRKESLSMIGGRSKGREEEEIVHTVALANDVGMDRVESNLCSLRGGSEVAEGAIGRLAGIVLGEEVETTEDSVDVDEGADDDDDDNDDVNNVNFGTGTVEYLAVDLSMSNRKQEQSVLNGIE